MSVRRRILMKAMVYERYGPPDVLQLKEVEQPIPKDDEVLIKVHAASINSWDWDLLRGTRFMARLGGLLKPKKGASFRLVGAVLPSIHVLMKIQ